MTNERKIMRDLEAGATTVDAMVQRLGLLRETIQKELDDLALLGVVEWYELGGMKNLLVYRLKK